jgi:hypothetical protein
VDPNNRIADYCNTLSVGDISVSEGGTAVFKIRRAGTRPRENHTVTTA